MRGRQQYWDLQYSLGLDPEIGMGPVPDPNPYVFCTGGLTGGVLDGGAVGG